MTINKLMIFQLWFDKQGNKLSGGNKKNVIPKGKPK